MSKTLDEMRKEFQHWLDTDRKLHEPSIFRNDEAWMAWQHQQAKIDRLTEALAFYANAGAYCCTFNQPDDRCPVLKDDGVKARIALKETP